MEKLFLEIFIVAVVLVSILLGANRGIIMSIFNLIKWILIVAASIGVCRVIERLLPTSITTARMGFAFAISFVICIVVFQVFSHIVKVVDDAPGITVLSRFGGAVMGAIIGVILAWTLLALIGAFQEYMYVGKIASSARESEFIMYVEKFNPFPAYLKTLGFKVL